MIPAHIQQTLEQMRQEIDWHNWRSGEIILEVIERPAQLHSIDELFAHLAAVCGIDRRPDKEKFYTHSRDEVMKAIDYGLSIKQNYTWLDYPFEDYQRKLLAQQFFSLFINPVYFTIKSELKQKRKVFSDFTNQHGTFAVDDAHIGVFWIYDVY
jgi:hypothetical protein